MRLDPTLIFWALGVVQPASKRHIVQYLEASFPNSTVGVTLSEIDRFLLDQEKEGNVMRVWNHPYHFSLTNSGNLFVSGDLRRLRDSARIFLLRDVEKGKIRITGDQPSEQDGDAPSFRNGNLHEDARPAKEAVHPHGLNRWPCISTILPVTERLSQARSPEVDLKLPYYSFSDKNQLAASAAESVERGITPIQVALSIGLSHRLFRFFTHKLNRNYRSFKIRKRDGGERRIDSPRLFLKVTQRWLADYLLSSLPIHHSCHSYKAGQSFITNAILHCNKKYVLNVDILDYFGSINNDSIKSTLTKCGLSLEAISLIANLTSFNNSLPQGAPTSPVLSNAFLYDFDKEIHHITEKEHLIYSRYSDDITISGNKKDVLISLLKILEKKLSVKGLKLNREKMKLISSAGRQMVTGVVVNNYPTPPRNLRRRIRAMFHNAGKNPEKYRDKISELNGYVSFLNAFDSLRKSTEIISYRKILKQIRPTNNARN